MFTRRKFLEATAAGTLSSSMLRADDSAKPVCRRLAVISNEWVPDSPIQQIVDRLLVGYPHEGEWQTPGFKIASAYVAQRSDADLTKSACKAFGFSVQRSVAKALRCGGRRLAVHGVLLFSNSQEPLRNGHRSCDTSQSTLFDQVAKVFAQDRRSVPVFIEGRPADNLEAANQIVDHGQKMQIPLLTGSSLPLTWRLPSVDLPYDARVDEALMVGFGDFETGAFHALEGMQAMLERRQHGETGVRSVQLIEGDEVWKAAQNNRWSQDLLEAALSRSNQLQGISRSLAKPQDLVRNGQLPELVKQPVALCIEYLDGTRATLLMLDGAVGDFTFAAKASDAQAEAQIISTLFYWAPEPNFAHTAEHAHQIVQLMRHGRTTVPLERTVLVTGLLEQAAKLKGLAGQKVSTPELKISYRPNSASQYARS